ncbi:sialidase family protein [Alkalicoccus daliensis]|uniref:Predicted neuraminidase (Sialidase) n=1 Tax=Alkalicoccus daliensis TaxID=745820 RepID=A0A1H0EXJ1_9BACI|nr:sialidase family protein [Alkalicoccus daliensis]SDN87092.1 Predicted neuraminidase (sialidase) [Alkalicoccus daliensis]
MNNTFNRVNDIKSPFPHNHASNLMVLDNGDLLCAWFGGSREGKPDISILVSRLENQKSEWNEPIVLKGDPEKSEQNPILFKNTNGDLWMLYTAQNLIHQDSAVVKCRISKDEGESWSEAETLFGEAGSFVRNPPLLIGDKIILPAYYSKKSKSGFLGSDHSVVKISEDHGETWKEYEVPESEGLVHMSIVKASDKLVGFFRSRKADYVYTTSSSDEGKTWTAPVKTELVNNNASIQSLRLENGNLMLIFNDTNAAENPPKENRPPWFDKADMETVKSGDEKEATSIWGVVRSPLTLALSEDEGITWSYKKKVISKEDLSEDIEEPEFSYPSIVEKDDELHISFTYLRKWIRHVQLSKEWIKK